MTALLASEPRISFSDLARREGVHVSTVWRWALCGIRGQKLESLSIGGRKFTSTFAFERWLAAINGEPTASGPTPRQRDRVLDAAESKAARLGI
jgi:hypothetical protein